MIVQASDWKLAKDDTKNGIQVFTRVVEGSPLKEFRGVANVPATLTAAAVLVHDHSAGPVWIQDCKELKTLERPSPTEAHFYMVTCDPWPVKDLVSTIYSNSSQDPRTNEARVEIEIRTELMEEKKGRFRLGEMHCSWVFTPVDAETTQVTYQAHVDPAGSLPNC